MTCAEFTLDEMLDALDIIADEMLVALDIIPGSNAQRPAQHICLWLL